MKGINYLKLGELYNCPKKKVDENWMKGMGGKKKKKRKAWENMGKKKKTSFFKMMSVSMHLCRPNLAECSSDPGLRDLSVSWCQLCH